MPAFTQELWTKTTNDFHHLWNFPNCIGAIDGCFNYKGFHSLVIMAVSDANYKFMYVDIGAYGSKRDSTVFQNCDFGKALKNKELRISEERVVNGKLVPNLFLTDDAFPLCRNLMKPYKPSKGQQLQCRLRKEFSTIGLVDRKAMQK
jgi:hypothetical protein